ncbi:efflux RND transporter periplasmic adaptor subunit [Aquabacterium sp.]|uniref:efflux RND transporter periplasmic adaptor subunit n=1 Tax=Aquabacterium sp. TaxID=1872578 RepID=UPI0035B15FA8
MNKNKFVAWFTPGRLVVILVVLVAAAWGIKKYFFTPPALPAVITSEASIQDMEDTVLASGTIQAATEVKVGAQASGQIKRLYVDVGDTVKKGQLVAEIDSTTQTNSLHNAEADVALYEAQLRAKQATLNQATLAYKRQKELLDQDAGSRADYEDAEATMLTAKAAIGEIEAQIKQAHIAVDTAKTNLGYTKIVAPIDGVVIAVLAEEGRTVNASQSAPTIIKINKLDTVEIKAQISEADVVRVKPGLPVYFTIMGEPDKRYDATLKQIEPAPDSEQTDSTSTSSSSSTSTSSSSSSSTTSAIYYNGLFQVPNPDGKLRVDMTAQVIIVLNKADHALVIPATALGEKGKDGRYTVRVLEGEEGKAQRLVARKVRVGLNNRVQAQVLEGLKEGDKVVVGEASGGSSSSSSSRRGGPPMF